ncbi:MAG: hypothetical protein Q4F80_04965 [bacterium]|nr:hypothetical protein [bacterium]
MAQRTRIKLSQEIDDEMKNRVKQLIKFVIIQKCCTFKAFAEEFCQYLQKKGKRNNFTDRVLSNKLNRGDIRFFEVLQIMDFLGYEIKFIKRTDTSLEQN